jgi:hypothetical protein
VRRVETDELLVSGGGTPQPRGGKDARGVLQFSSEARNGWSNRHRRDYLVRTVRGRSLMGMSRAGAFGRGIVLRTPGSPSQGRAYERERARLETVFGVPVL